RRDRAEDLVAATFRKPGLEGAHSRPELRIIDPRGLFGERRRRSPPAQRLHVVEERRVGTQRRELLEQQRRFAARTESLGRGVLEPAPALDETRRRLRAVAVDAPIAIGRGSPHEGEYSVSRRRRHAVLRLDRLVVSDLAASPVHLDDAVADDALREVL